MHEKIDALVETCSRLVPGESTEMNVAWFLSKVIGGPPVTAGNLA